jgi:hypothetical protein
MFVTISRQINTRKEPPKPNIGNTSWAVFRIQVEEYLHLIIPLRKVEEIGKDIEK